MTGRETGQRGEDAALKYLKRKGYRLLERNYRAGRKELDLIMRDRQGGLVFVEVKTRASTAFGTPGEAVDYRKQQNIITAAQFYLQQTGQDEIRARFDVVEVSPQGIRHIENAFMTNP